MRRNIRGSIGALLLLGTAVLLFCCPGCRAPMLPPPSAEELLSYETKPFVCAFTVTEPDGSSFSALFERTETDDRLTVFGEYGSRTVFRFAGENVFLCCAGGERGEPVSVPVLLPRDRGAALWRSMFSLIFEGPAAVTRTEDGLSVTAGQDSLLFSEDGTLRSVVRCDADRETVLSVTSFTLQT